MRLTGLLFLIMAAAFCACDRKPESSRVQPNFMSIDLSRSDGWHDHYCIHVDSNGRAIVKRTFEGDDYEIFYTATLNDSVMKQVFEHVERIGEEFPELKPDMCIDCPFYNLELVTPKVRLDVSHQHHTPREEINDLVNYFTTLIQSGIFKEADTTYKFTSFDGLIPPRLGKDSVIIFQPPSINR